MKNIVLIGPRGTGKTAIGRKLAESTRRKFIDTDSEIEKITGKRIPEIFMEKGEKGFREIEKDVVRGVAGERNVIISTGGGIVLARENISGLKRNGTIVLLEASPGKMAERIKGGGRPALTKHENAEDEIGEILRKREGLYRGAADFIVETENDSIEKNAAKVLKELRRGRAQTVTVSLKEQTRSYDIAIGRGLDREVASEIRKRQKGQAGIITDANVMKLYGAALIESLGTERVNAKVFTLKNGEGGKSLREFERISLEMLGKGFDRQGILIALGGGAVGDLAGFVAATFMRGIPLIQMPTTLLAMVDSGIGGKSAINLGKTKNIIGAFRQPEKVFVDLQFLKTLPQEELRNGLVEAVKTGTVMDEKLFRLIENNLDEIMAGKDELLKEVVERCCRVKAKIVEEDEKEQNLRSVLNFGHTIGHGIEAVNNISHGRAIAIGMVLESMLAEKKGILPKKEGKRIDALVRKIGLNMEININAEKILEKMRRDKKNAGGGIRMVLPKRIGKMHSANGKFVLEVSEGEVLEILKEGLK